MAIRYKYTGTVHQVGKTMEFASGFKKRTLVLKTENGQYVNYGAFDFMRDAVLKLDNLRIGEPVEVEFYTEANESRKTPGQWFVSNRAVSVARMSPAAQNPAYGNSAGHEAGGAENAAVCEADNDLPF